MNVYWFLWKLPVYLPDYRPDYFPDYLFWTLLSSHPRHLPDVSV